MAQIMMCVLCGVLMWSMCQASCVEEAEHSLGLIGGWQYHTGENSVDQDTLRALVNSAVSTYNSVTNGIRYYKAAESDIGEPMVHEVYTQVPWLLFL